LAIFNGTREEVGAAMDAIREWWATVVRTSASWIAGMWQRLVYGITEGWDVRLVVLCAGVVVIGGAFIIMRRRA
jgi:hypothetical protein